jgi:hypothetical protein
MAQEPPEDHKCKDKFLVQSAILPSSLAHLPPADIVSLNLSLLISDCSIAHPLSSIPDV